MATASHAGFSINLPGFGLHLPLPGASVNIGLPFVGPPAHPSHHEVAQYERLDYGRHNGHNRSYGYRNSNYRTYGDDGYYHGPDRFAEGGRTGFYGGRY